MNPQEVMDGLAQRYASCSTYFDCGSAFCWDNNVDKTDQRKLVFKTFFERPFKFRFEWSQEIPTEPLLSERNFNIVWSDGIQAAYSYDCEPGPCNEENLVYAIAGATGISMGSAFEVPALLIPEVREESNHLLLLKDLRLTESEVVGEHDCFRIVGSSCRPEDTVLWISKSDYSLRKVQEFSLITAEQSAQWAEELRVEFGDEGASSLGIEYEDRSHFTVLTYETVTFDADISVGTFNYDPKATDENK